VQSGFRNLKNEAIIEQFVEFLDEKLSPLCIQSRGCAPDVARAKGGKEVVGKEKEAPPVPYAMPCWKNILNNTTITVGVNNIWGQDPPPMFGFELGNSVAYPGSTYDNLGRFVYFRMIKKF